ncbi:MAG: RsmE family RNA methyltransferase [Desulfonauticus sp.]|nr:RsmE family RNA methyltransferase [Desulfonauticus sp.]
MARVNSFYLPPDKWKEPFILEADEAHHFLKVLRGKPGDIIRLFDGQGKEGRFKVTKIKNKIIYLKQINISQHQPPKNKIYLALAWQRSKKRDLVLEKCVELNCWEIIFWPAKYSPPFPKTIKSSWPKKLIAAAKQCENVWLPQISLCPDLGTLYSKFCHVKNKIFFWEKETNNIITRYNFRGDILVLIGPEGGFSDEEYKFLQTQDFLPISLGKSILRLETATIVGLGYIYLQFSEKN